MDIAGITLGFIAVIGGLAIAPLAIILGIRQAQRKREMEHIERMKALELGRTLPQDEPWLSPTKIGAAIGILVPIAALVAAATQASRLVIMRRSGSPRRWSGSPASFAARSWS